MVKPMVRGWTVIQLSGPVMLTGLALLHVSTVERA